MRFNSKKPLLIFFVGFIFSLILYSFTLGKGIVWGDSAKLTLYAIDSEIHWESIATHPLHTLFAGWLLSIFPHFEPATIVNLLSAIFASASVGLTGLIARQLSPYKEAPYITMTLLAFSHTFWTLAVIAESYSLALCFGALITWLLLLAQAKRNNFLTLGSGVISGLSIGANALTLIALPGFIHLQLLNTNKRNNQNKLPTKIFIYIFGIIIGLFCLKLLALIIGGLELSLSSLFSIVSGQSKEYMRGFSFSKLLLFFPNFLYQFPWFPTVLIVWVIKKYSFRQKFNCFKYLRNLIKAISWNEWSLIICSFSVLFFSSSYQYQRHFVFLSYPFLFISILLGCWLAPWFRGSNSCFSKFLALLLIPFLNIGLYTTVFRVPKIANVLKTRELPGRDSSYFFQPWKHLLKPTASEWSKNWLSGLPKDSIILADFTVSRVLKFTKRQISRNDLSILETDEFLTRTGSKGEKEFIELIIKQVNTGKPVYIGDRHPEYYFLRTLKSKFKLVSYGNGARVLLR